MCTDTDTGCSTPPPGAARAAAGPSRHACCCRDRSSVRKRCALDRRSRISAAAASSVSATRVICVRHDADKTEGREMTHRERKGAFVCAPRADEKEEKKDYWRTSFCLAWTRPIISRSAAAAPAPGAIPLRENNGSEL